MAKGKTQGASPGMEWDAYLRKLENMSLHREKACKKSDLMVKRKSVKEKEEIRPFFLCLMGLMF